MAQDAGLICKMERAIEFLDFHPAVNGSMPFLNSFYWYVLAVCKNGHCREHGIPPGKVDVKVRTGTKLFKRFKDKYGDKEDDYDSPFSYFHVPYREVYGYDWEFHKYEYFADFSIYRLIVPKKTTSKNRFDEMYSAYEGGYVRADSFEQLLVNCARDVRKNYGDFRNFDFLTDEERKNHETEDRFFHVPIERNGKDLFELKHNPKWIDVSDGTLNLRWWDWYMKTDHFKKHWGKTFKSMERIEGYA